MSPIENTGSKRRSRWYRAQEGLGMSIAVFGTMVPITLLFTPWLLESFGEEVAIGIMLFAHTAAGAVVGRVFLRDDD